MKSRVLVCALLASLSFSVGGCDSIIYSGPSDLTTNKAEVYQENFSYEIATGELTQAEISGISNQYWSNGTGPLRLWVSYDPQSKVNTAMNATRQAEKMKSALAKGGIKDIESEIIPVAESGETSGAMISFKTLAVRAPGDCPEPMGIDFVDIKHNKDYKMGCSIETYTAKQIARPKDLLGQDTMDNDSGRRNANTLEIYQQGKPNAELKGANASEE